jgi:hypothetical protein
VLRLPSWLCYKDPVSLRTFIDPLQRIGGAPQGVADVEEQADQRRRTAVAAR